MPALSAIETGMRLGVGSRSLVPPERNGPRTRSSNSRYAVWVCMIGLGRPVVPDVAPFQPERTKSEPARAVPLEQAERDAQARTMVVQELEKARQQLQQQTQEYNEGEPVKWAAEARNHQKYLDRVASLKAAMARTERDIDSLQRELARRPLLARTTTP